MKKYLSSIVIVLMCLCASAQEDSLRVFFDLGLGYSQASYDEVQEPQYALDIFPLSKRDAVNVTMGLGYKLTDKWEIELDFMHKGLSVDGKSFNEAHQERHPDFYVYHDFNQDETNSTITGLRYNSLTLGVNRNFNLGLVSLVPSVKLGTAFWEHREYAFVLRGADSNEITEYTVTPSFSPQLAYRTGFKVLFNTKLKFFLDVSMSGSPIRFDYEVSDGCTAERIQFESSARFFSVGIGLRPFLQEEEYEPEIE